MKLTTTTIILGTLVHLHMLFGQYCWAQEQTIKCHNDRIDKTFIIQKGSMVIYNLRSDDQSGRKVASITANRNQNGFDKIVRFEGNRYQLHIENINQLSPIDDYISIRSSKGHEIIYPVECKLE